MLARFGIMSVVVIVVAVSAAILVGSVAGGSAAQAPVLKWQRGGCYSSWCETGWYSSPVIADINQDGKAEVVGSGYSVVALDGASGTLLWRVNSGHDRTTPTAGNVGRTWPSIAVADVDLDGLVEIVTAHGGGWVSVYSGSGYFKPGWPLHPVPEEFRSLAIADLDGDGKLEILAAATRSYNQWFVFEPNGTSRAGAWPQHYPDSDTNGYTAGCYNENLAAGDIDADGRGELIGPSDVHYIAAFEDTGQQVRASTIYGTNPDNSARVWSRVGVHVSHAVDLRGYANCGAEHRPNFANSAPLIADVDRNGVPEIIVVGNVYNCGTDPYTDLYEMPFIFNADRTRWQGAGYDWTDIPLPDAKAAPLTEDYNVIENSVPNPVAVDLDGDGRLEILFPSYDGRLHAFWLDKTEHGNWPYSVYDSAEGFYRFASEPAVADLDGDGKAEVIFASWPQKTATGPRLGKLHVVDYLGRKLYEVTLPIPPTGAWNGALAAPTLGDLDGDGELEVVVNTTASGLVAYDLPGTSHARVLWATGRGGYTRSGVAPRVVWPLITPTAWLYLPYVRR